MPLEILFLGHVGYVITIDFKVHGYHRKKLNHNNCFT